MNENVKRIESFFQEYSLASDKFYQTDGAINRSVDASGWNPSVTLEVAKILGPYIQNLLGGKDNITHLDCGTGLGLLPKTLFEMGFNSYGVEGAQYLTKPSNDYQLPTGYHDSLGPHPGIQASKARILIADLCKPINDARLRKAFDITTSFEVIEHVHRGDQLKFWSNITFLSNHHLCGIHVANEEHDHHCTINPPSVWERIFDDLGIKWSRLENFPITQWRDSVFYFLTLPNEMVAQKVDFGTPQIFQSLKMKVLKNERIRKFKFDCNEVGLLQAIKVRLR